MNKMLEETKTRKYDYMKIEDSLKYLIIDRVNLKIIEVDTYSKEINDITKEILKYYNKNKSWGYNIFKMFITGKSDYNLIYGSNDRSKFDNHIDFDLYDYYFITSKSKSMNKKAKCYYNEKRGINIKYDYGKRGE